MNKMVLILAMTVTFLGNVTADSQDFTVSIASREKSKNWPYTQEGLPIVYYTVPSVQPQPPSFTDWNDGEQTAYSFFVVIQNMQTTAAKISAGESAWYDCLEFTIATESGKTYHVSRRRRVWYKNTIETWTIPGSGKRVIPVDLTSGGWQGLPLGAWPYPEIATMTATFRYPDSTGKVLSVPSIPTDVYFSDLSWAGNAADPKGITIPGFSIRAPSQPGGESWMIFSKSKPLEISRYCLTNETLERPLMLTIVRYANAEQAKRAFDASGLTRQVAPEAIRISDWEAAHRWIAYRDASDTYLLKGDFVVELNDLPLDLPDAKKSQLFEGLADYIARAASDDETNGIGQNGIESTLTKQISAVLRDRQTIKPGMTRSDLLKVFTTEGGLSTAMHRTFVYRGCPYIKVDVDFRLSDPGQSVLEEKPTDIIVRISEPYLEWSIID